MIGLALVTLVACLPRVCGHGFRGSVNKAFVANYAITATNNFSPICLARTNGETVPGVTAVVGGPGRRWARVRLDRERHGGPAERQPGDQVDWTHGSSQIPAKLGRTALRL